MEMFSQETSARIGANDGSDSSASCFRRSFFRRRFKLFYKRYNNCVRNNDVQKSNLRRYCDSGMQRSHNSSNDRRNLRRQWDMEGDCATSGKTVRDSCKPAKSL